MISVVIPLYNKEHYIADTLKSVLKQTCSDFEVIVIDDGSTDHSAEIVATFHDERIHYIFQENQGVAAARNRGIREATGEFIAFLDADDCWFPDYLEKMTQLAAAYPHQHVFCSAQENRIINTLPDGVTIISDHCLYDYIYFTGCMFLRREVFDKAGCFREGIQLGEDRDMWLRMACHYPTVYLNEATVSHSYQTENNLSRSFNPSTCCPYWEWYSYPYKPKSSLYRYTTNQIVDAVSALIARHDYRLALRWLNRCRGWSALRPRLKLYSRIAYLLLTEH